MLSLEESKARWQITMARADSLGDLKLAIRSQNNDSPCVSGLRSVCWKIFLLFHTVDSSSWSGVLADSRSAYTSLKEHLLRYVERPNEIGSSIDPLNDDKNVSQDSPQQTLINDPRLLEAKSEKSPWNILRQDEELRAEIQQDVERCMPEEQYFRQAKTQRMLLDILFIFCKMNPDVGYRQGMHELLAPILWVVENDSVNIVDMQTEDFAGDEQMLNALTASFLEHDAFTIYSLLMQSAKSFYELGEPERRASNTSGQGSKQSGTSPIVDRSKRIHQVYLASLDPELADHLTAIEVLPQIFLIRWIRILFGREFAFESLLSLWDLLFAEDPGLDLVDMICVAMLLRIRWQLLEADYSTALILLLKYPVPDRPHGPQTFVEDAIYLRENFSKSGAREIITTYSRRVPQNYASSSRPATPSGEILNSDQKISWRRSPLPSPARFLQHQGGVEALLQGAAKGVFERGERLGINKAVRDAVGEVKKNMQNLQAPSPPSIRRSPDVIRQSQDESRANPSSRKTVLSMEQRNKQLSQMLDDALGDLRSLSTVEIDATSSSRDAIDLAIAKLQFIHVYLEDSSLPLPTEPSQNTSATKPLPNATTDSKSLKANENHLLESQNEGSSAQSTSSTGDASPANSTEALKVGNLSRLPSSSTTPPTSGEEALAIPARPRAPIPTRSTLAQSSFAFMLQPDESSITATKSSSSKASSPFLASGRRPLSGGNREKAFLFGGEPDDGDHSPWNHSVYSSTNQEYNLGTINSSKNR